MTGHSSFLTNMRRQRQKIIMAQSASPVSSGIQLTRLEKSPIGIRTRMPVNDMRIFLFKLVEG